MSRPRPMIFTLTLMLACLAGLNFAAEAPAQRPSRAVTDLGDFTLSIGLVNDNVWVFELSPEKADPTQPFEPSLMIAPEVRFRAPDGGGDNWSSATVRLKIDHNPPALTLIRDNGEKSFSITPYAPDGQLTGISFIGEFSHLLGLGADFILSSRFFNLLGETIMPGSPFGNSRLSRQNYRPNQVQVPVLYGMGQGKHSSALFIDETLPLMWSFKGRPWTVQVAGPLGPTRAFRFFVITGPDMPALRREFMALTGRPPVPPLKAMGVWACDLKGTTESDWRDKVNRLKNSVPALAGLSISGTDNYSLLLDITKSLNLKLMLDESAYVSQDSPLYSEMARRSYLVRQNGPSDPIMVVNHNNARSGLVDYTNPAVATFWHSLFRNQQITDGVTSFRLIDGDLDDFSPSAWYEGPPNGRIHSHYAWANSYALKWLDGIMAGVRGQWMRNRPRLMLLSRTATAGLPRLSGMLFNGDATLFGSRSLLAVKAHVALSGVDYYSSDLSSLWNSFPIDSNNQQLYDAWVAKSTLTDIPLMLPEEALLRPGTRYNLAVRESLTPYIYSLAWEAYLKGNPVIAPLAHYFQEDQSARDRIGELMLGDGLLLGLDLDSASERINVYVPQGLWYDWRSGEVIDQQEAGILAMDAKEAGQITPPMLALSGSIIPTIEEMTDKAGQIEKISALKIFIGPEVSEFTWYEDDGETLNYQSGAERYGKTLITAETNPDGSTVVTLKARSGSWEGAPAERQLLFDIYGPKAPGEATLDNMPHNRVARASELGQMESGWASFGNNRIRFKTPPLDVNEDHVLWFK